MPGIEWPRFDVDESFFAHLRVAPPASSEVRQPPSIPRVRGLLAPAEVEENLQRMLDSRAQLTAQQLVPTADAGFDIDPEEICEEVSNFYTVSPAHVGLFRVQDPALLAHNFGPRRLRSSKPSAASRHKGLVLKSNSDRSSR
ncbi:unnamed protein product [Sympodiomycopsis kandeliae]